MAKPAVVSIDDLKSVDLVTLQAEIDALESDLLTVIHEKRKEIDGRRELLKVCQVLQHGKPPKKPRQPRTPKPASTTPGAEPTPHKGRRTDRDRIADLVRAAGRMQVHQIAAKLSLTESRCTSVMSDDPLFEMDQNGRWSILG
jgi:hypothetical protein